MWHVANQTFLTFQRWESIKIQNPSTYQQEKLSLEYLNNSYLIEMIFLTDENLGKKREFHLHLCLLQCHIMCTKILEKGKKWRSSWKYIINLLLKVCFWLQWANADILKYPWLWLLWKAAYMHRCRVATTRIVTANTNNCLPLLGLGRYTFFTCKHQLHPANSN